MTSKFGTAWRLSTLFSSALLAAVGPRALADGQAQASPVSVTTTPVAVAHASTHADMILLTVDKSTLQASLETWPEDASKSHELKSFRIAIGKEEGDKQHEGDNKTPEGIYFAQSHIDGKALPEKYGNLAIPIDFPNPIDQVAGKTGHGIWLHGVDNDQRIEKAKVTEGCVAFYNSDIARLSTWLKAHQGVVVIANHINNVNKAEDLKAVRERTLGWMQAWQNRNADGYVAYYANDFRYNHYDLKGYSAYKKRVFASYKKMDLKFDSLRVVSHPKYAVSFFNQDFNGDNRFRSVGRKILYWERDGSGQWLIKREVFENRRFEYVTFTDAELALLSAPSSSISSDKEQTAPSL